MSNRGGGHSRGAIMPSRTRCHGGGRGNRGGGSRRNSSQGPDDVKSQMQPKEIFASVALNDFPAHVKESGNRIDDAFDSFDIEMEVLQMMSLSPEFTRQIYAREEIKNKNRYHDVIPNVDHRVKLKIINDDQSSDYINASFVEKNILPGAEHKYIAAMAPTSTTFNDWWRMVWEQKINIILMLTKLFENQGETKKADRYWPNYGKDASEQYDEIQVIPTDERNETDDLIIRKFSVIHLRTHEKRDLELVQYIGWPDGGIPKEYDSFHAMFEYYRQIRGRTSGPILTHCSAGIGRTGTFCTVDIILDNINLKRLAEENVSNPLINVFNVVKALRDYRPGMVQSKAQYAFCSKFLCHCMENKLLGVGLLSSHPRLEEKISDFTSNSDSPSKTSPVDDISTSPVHNGTNHAPEHNPLQNECSENNRSG